MTTFLEILESCPVSDQETLTALWEFYLELPSEDRESLTVPICQKLLDAGLRDHYQTILQLINDQAFLASFCQKILQTEDREYYRQCLEIAIKLDQIDLVKRFCSAMRSANMKTADRRIVQIALRSDDFRFFKDTVQMYCTSPERLIEVIEIEGIGKQYFKYLIEQYHSKYLNQINTMAVLVFSRLAVLYPDNVKIEQILDSQARLTNRRSEVLDQGVVDQAPKTELGSILDQFAEIDKKLSTITDSKIAYQLRCKRADLVKVYLDKYREHLYSEIDNIGYYDRLHGKFVNDPRISTNDPDDEMRFKSVIRGTGACLPVRKLYEYYSIGKLSTVLPVPYKMLAVMPKKDERRPNPKDYVNGGRLETIGFKSQTHEYDYSWHPLDLEVQVYSSIPDPTKRKKSQAELKRLDKPPTVKGAKVKIKSGGSSKVSFKGETGYIRFTVNESPLQGEYYLKAEKGYCYVYDRAFCPVLFLCKYVTRMANEKENMLFDRLNIPDDCIEILYGKPVEIRRVYEITEINPKISQKLVDLLILHFDKQYNPVLGGLKLSTAKLEIAEVTKAPNYQGCTATGEVDRDDPANQRVFKKEKKEFKPLTQPCTPKEFKAVIRILRKSNNNPVIRKLWEQDQYQTILRVVKFHKGKDWSKLTLSEILN